MLNTKPPSIGSHIKKVLFLLGYLAIIFACVLVTQATCVSEFQVAPHGWYIFFGVSLLIASVLIIVSYSIALFDSWLNPLQFQQSESENAKRRAAGNKFLRLITITNGKFLLWWWRLISPPIVVFVGILLFKLAISFLYR
jgi:hypothetical protein